MRHFLYLQQQQHEIRPRQQLQPRQQITLTLPPPPPRKSPADGDAADYIDNDDLHVTALGIKTSDEDLEKLKCTQCDYQVGLLLLHHIL